ncbi:unnamed protein product [Brassica oleracea var. botrytis]
MRGRAIIAYEETEVLSSEWVIFVAGRDGSKLHGPIVDA